MWKSEFKTRGSGGEDKRGAEIFPPVLALPGLEHSGMDGVATHMPPVIQRKARTQAYNIRPQMEEG